MFNHRRIKHPDACEKYKKVQKTISREASYEASKAIGGYVAEDMIEFVGTISRSDIDVIYIKYRDGRAMAAGMRNVLPKVNIEYITTQYPTENGFYHNKEPEITFLNPDMHFNPSDEFVWFADPINSTGKTDIEVMGYLRKQISFNTGMLSHMVASELGVRNVQTMITDFNCDGYMNYTYLAKRVDPQTGFLMPPDALEHTRDYGDKLEGTLGVDYPIWKIQEDIRGLMGTGAGETKILEGVIIYLIQKRTQDQYKGDRDVSWSTREWITAALSWYKVLRDIPFKFDIPSMISYIKRRRYHGEKERHLRVESSGTINTILKELVYEDFLKVEKIPWRDKEIGVYSITQDGANFSSAVYLPILAGQGLLNPINEDFDFLVHLKSNQIYEEIYSHHEDNKE